MIKVGLTGNIGSGKSLVAEMFAIYGVPVYNSDKESKKFLNDPFVKEKITGLFGDEILNSSGDVDRTALAAIVFTNEQSLKALNAILHPMVMDDFSSWCEALGEKHPYVLQEAAIIFESGAAAMLDKIIHVSCPKEIAVERVMRRDGINEESVLQRMQFQMDDAQKAKLADFVICNDGSEMIIPQVLSIHEKLSAVGAQH